MSEYKVKDLLEEIRQCLWEKEQVLHRHEARNNVPMAGLTQIRVDRLKAIGNYILEADKRSKAEEKTAEPEKVAHPEPEAAPDKAPAVEEEHDDFDD